MNILDFRKKKQHGIPVTMVTCYDHAFAALLNDSPVDCLLVGDSAAMVMHGHDSTIAADLQMMSSHTKAVRSGAPDAFIIADMPFLSYRKGVPRALDAVEELMKAGASAVKLEGLTGHEQVIEHIVSSGVPVMGHLGLTPQSVHAMGGYRVQARGAEAAGHLLEAALRLQELGCFSLVLECVPAAAAAEVSRQLEIPVIGIGAGADTDGQVLVLQDLLGMSPGKKPRFVREFLPGRELIGQALRRFTEEVAERTFPGDEESYR